MGRKLDDEQLAKLLMYVGMPRNRKFALDAVRRVVAMIGVTGVDIYIPQYRYSLTQYIAAVMEAIRMIKPDASEVLVHENTVDFMDYVRRKTNDRVQSKDTREHARP